MLDKGLGAKEHAESSYYFTLRGLEYYKRKESPDDLHEFLAALKLDQKNVMAHCYCALISAKQFDFANACHHIAQAMIHATMDNYDLRKKIFDQIKFENLAATALEMAKEAQQQQQKLQLAEEYLAIAKKGTPRNQPQQRADVLVQRAWVRKRCNNLPDAIRDLQRAIKLINEGKQIADKFKLLTDLYWKCGEYQYRDKKYNDAIVSLTHSLTNSHDDNLRIKLFFYRAKCHKELKNFVSAIADLKECLAIGSPSSTVRKMIAELEPLVKKPEIPPSQGEKRPREEEKVSAAPQQEKGDDEEKIQEPAPKKLRLVSSSLATNPHQFLPEPKSSKILDRYVPSPKSTPEPEERKKSESSEQHDEMSHEEHPWQSIPHTPLGGQQYS